MAESCDECSPCWPHLGGFGRCPCDCHPADPATDLEYAMAVIEYLLAENERLREALRDLADAYRGIALNHPTVVTRHLPLIRAEEVLSGSSATASDE